MIRLVKCNGFRSLSDFELEIRPGINLLVGPNGSGKTNIISFLWMLGRLGHGQLPEIISALGGAGATFRKIGSTEYVDEISASVTGYVERSPRRFFKYKYDFVIALSGDRDAVLYRSQRLVVSTCSKSEAVSTEPPESMLELVANVSADNKLSIEARADKAFPINVPRKDLVQFLSYMVGRDDCLISAVYRISHELTAMLNDFGGGLSLNVVPSNAKAAEDSTVPPGIQGDGSGLYATLRAVKKASDGADSRPRRRYPIGMTNIGGLRRLQADTFHRVLSAAKLANSSIYDISIHNDPFDNKLKGSIHLETGSIPTEISFSAMSDGTIKWLALVAAIYTSPQMFSIEEPENYLHPLVQMEVISMLRAEFKDNKFVIVSTHSETILNSVNPSEVVVVEFKDGRTSVGRPASASEIKREIKRTGFGLGYYYISGALNV